MAVFVPIINGLGYGVGNGAELFVATDIYRYDVDNRPLENLVANDVAIKASLDDVVGEIDDSYEGTNWPVGTTPYIHASLDARLDNMDLFLQELFEIRNIQFSSFQQFAAFLRERYTSGFMNGPFPNTFIRSNFAMENNEAMPSPYGGFYSPEHAQTVYDQNEPDVDVRLMVAMETRIEQDNGITYRAVKKPMRVLVNGYVVSLLNAHGGTNQTDQSLADRRACGVNGPVTIGFPAAPASGSRFDFAFLESFLTEVGDAGPFYPYGCRDYCIWAREQIGTGDGASSTYSGTLDGRMLMKKTEGGHYLRIFNRTDASAIDWTTELTTTAICEDNGSGALVPLNASGCSGTINYETGAWVINVAGGSEANVDDVIVAAYRHRAVTDPEDERLQGTLSFLPSGSYLQVQNQIRVVPGVTYETYPNWFTEADGTPNAEIEALGNKELDTVPAGPVSGYTFTNALNDLHDGTLFRAGNGDASSISDLGTLDGYVYAVPLCAWARFNTNSWALDNQNGGVDRPDGLTHDVPDDKHFLDLRPVVLAERYDMKSAAENTLDRILRGEHRTVFGEALVDYADVGNVSAGEDVWGSLVPEQWRIYAQVPGTISTHTNLVRDIGLATSNNPAHTGGGGDPGTYTAPRAWHDGIRRVFSPQEEVQKVSFTITDVTASTAATPDSIVTYNNTTKVITLSTNDTSLSGYSATAGEGVIINDSLPRLYWRGTRQPVVLTSALWTGLGTNTATAEIDTSVATWQDNGTIDGVVDLLYPECTGIARPVKEVDGVEFYDGGNTYITQIKGNADGSPDDPATVAWKLDNSLEPGFTLPGGMCIDPTNAYVYVCDSANARVVKLDITDLSQVAQFPAEANYPWEAPFDSTTDLRYPSDVAVNATTGDVYVVDRERHQVIRLDSDLVYISSPIGTLDTPETDPSVSGDDLSFPEGITIDTAQNIFVADTGLYRIVKYNLSYVLQDVIGNGYSGAGKDQFLEPTGLSVGTIGADDFVYVADQNRVVVVDATQCTVDNILGSKTTNNVQKFYRNTYSTFYGFVENANGDKYAVNYDRKLLMKFDSAWNLLATYGEDGVALDDDLHFNHPRDVILDEEADLIYVSGFGSSPSAAYVRVFDYNLNLIDSISTLAPNGVPGDGVSGNTSGMALVQDAVGTDGKLYVVTHLGVIKFALPASGSRGDTTQWSVDWTLTVADTGWTGADQPRYMQDCEVTADGTLLFVNDGLWGRVYAIDPTGVAPSLLDTLQCGYKDHRLVGQRGLLGMYLSSDETYLYQTGGGAPNIAGGGVYNGYETTPHIRKIDVSAVGSWDITSVEQLVDEHNWQPGDNPVNIHVDVNDDLYVMTEHDMLVYGTTGTGHLIDTAGEISGGLSYNIYDLPVSIDLKLDSPWMGVRATYTSDDVLYVADTQGNTITAINMDSYFVLGTIGGPAAIGRGKASCSGPGGVAVTGQQLLFSDTFNNRVVSGYRFFPQVERGTGRISYLMAPPDSSRATFQVRYAPYQGQWSFLGESAVYGRHYVTENEKIYITTMGRGASSRIDPSSGISYYASMISHIPIPADVPFKAPVGSIGCRITDDYLFAPQKLDIIKDGGTPYVALPVITRYPSSAQEMNPWYGAGSRYDFNRFFFVQGPGPGHAVDTSNSPIDTWDLKTARGYTGNGFMPGFDTLITFPLQDVSIPRIVFSSMTVELGGQGYLLIYSSYAARAGNVLNNGQFLAVDVFKLFGNPGIKTRY